MPGEASAAKCLRCGELHPLPECPYVKAVDFFKNGKVRRVEFLTPADFGPQPKSSGDAETGEDYPKLKPMGGA